MQKNQQAELERKQMEYTIAKDEEKRRKEDLKIKERKEHALGLMRDVEQKKMRESYCSEAGRRGQKMTQEELRINRELLKEVAQIKKRGEFANLFEKCVSNKVTSNGM